jgi:hypothetical protein
MNERLTELYRASRPKEALASQDEFKSANALLGSDVEKFAKLIVKDCIALAEQYGSGGAGSEFDVGYLSCANTLSEEFKKRFGVDE